MSQAVDILRKTFFLSPKNPNQAGRRDPLKTSVIRPAAKTGFSGWLNRKFFGWKAREALYDDLSSKLMNNQTDITALERYRDMLLLRKRRTRAAIVNDILRRARQEGNNLALAFAPWVPKEEAKIIEGGQRAGDIPKALETIIQMNENRDQMKGKVIAAISMPAFYTLLIYVFLLFVGIYITPQFTKFLPNPTGIGAMLYAEGRFVDSWQAFVPPVFALSVTALFAWSLPRWTGKYRTMFDQHLPYAFFKETRGYIWMVAFIAMLESGMSDVEILRQQIRDTDPWMKERLRCILHELSTEGSSLPIALRVASVRGVKFEFPNPGLIDTIDGAYGYEDTPERLTKSLKRWSYRYDKMMSNRIKWVGYIAQTVLYGIMGFLLLALNAISQQLGTSGVFH